MSVSKKTYLKKIDKLGKLTAKYKRAFDHFDKVSSALSAYADNLYNLIDDDDLEEDTTDWTCVCNELSCLIVTSAMVFTMVTTRTVLMLKSIMFK
jgi:hypothetical protein